MSYQINIQQATLDNTDFRRVLYTTPLSQLVVMCIQPGDDIGLETHHLDQILFFVSGRGEALLNSHRSGVGPGDAVVVPAGTQHNFTNTGSEPLRLFTVYSPPEHADGTVHRTHAVAMAAEALEHGGGHDGAPAAGAPATVGSLIGSKDSDAP